MIWSILKTYFNSYLLKIDKKSKKNIDVYYIGYITIKYTYYVNINSVNPLCLIINKEDDYIKEKMVIKSFCLYR